MTLRAYRDFDPNDPDNYNQTNQEYDTGNDAVDFQGTFLDQNQYGYAYRGQAPVTPKSRLFIVAGVLGLVAIGFAAAFTFSANSGSDLPIITADTTSYKTKPETPGGIEIPFQDKLVFNRLDPEGQQVQAERLLPPPEEPMTLALQPAVREPSNPAPKDKLAVEENVVSAATTNKVATPVKPVVEPAVPVAKVEKLAPTTGAVPAPINEEVVAQPKLITPSETPKAVVAAPVTTGTKTATLEPVAEEGAYNDAPAAKVVAETPKPAVKATPAVAGGSRVQLGSLPEKGAADRALAKFKSDYAGVLGGAQLTLVKAEIPGKGTFWRVQSQPIDKAEAQKICNGVKAKGGACLLAK